jgi:NAD+ kinase
MKHVGLCANTDKPRAAEVVACIVAACRERDLQIVADPATAAMNADLPAACCRDFRDKVDAVIALGGDGTLLDVVHRLEGVSTPVIGVNIGGLGFLTSVSEDEIAEALDCLVHDRFSLFESRLIACSLLRGGKAVSTRHALNEVVVARGTTSRVIQLAVKVDGHDVTTYSCDGMLVATPIGSTGYSVSAGGPILVPGTPAHVLTPICPHTLGSRPMVIPDHCTIEIIPHVSGQELLVSADGQAGQALQDGDVLLVRRSERAARLIRLPDHSFFELLRQKLHWRGSSVRG